MKTMQEQAEMMRALAFKTKCPAAGCGVMKAKSVFMCRRHWFLLEDWMRREIWTYYRNRNWTEYFKVAKRAIAHVNAMERVETDSGGGTGRNETLRLL